MVELPFIVSRIEHMNKLEIYKADIPKTLGEVYQKVAEILQQPERQGKPNVLLQFDGFAPDIGDLSRGIQELYPAYSSAGGFHWSVKSDKLMTGDHMHPFFREHPVSHIPKDEGYIHVFLVFVYENGDGEKQQDMLFEP
jgi:hypothetical protein